jgi:TolA-binding protein
MEGLQMSEQSAAEYYNEGLEHAKAGSWSKALECFNKAIVEDPRHVNSYNALGKVHHQRGELSAARKCWQTALKIDPDNITARQCLASVATKPSRILVGAQLWIAVVVVLVLAALVITNAVLLRRIDNLETELARASAPGEQTPEPETQISATDEQDEADQASQQVPTPESDEQGASEAPIIAEPSPVEISPPVPSDTPVTALEVYNQSLADCTDGWYNQAIRGFQKVLSYPSSPELKDNAQYWLAECYYAQKDYVKALPEFQKVKENYPEGNKVFDAEIKVAYTYWNLGQAEQARQKLSQISEAWPGQQYQTQISILAEKVRSGQLE